MRRLSHLPRTGHELVRAPRTSRRQTGLTLVELMVGIAIGLLLITGATSLFVSNLDSSRRLLLEARLNQNVRAAAELITRDLRRAGYWDEAVEKVRQIGNNPNRTVTSTGSSVNYRFSAPGSSSDEVAFSLSNSTLRMSLGGGTPQDLTDPNVATITEFTINPVVNEVPISNQAIGAAPGGTPKCLFERRYDITIVAEAPTDASIRRVLHTAVRVRNDQVDNCS